MCLFQMCTYLNFEIICFANKQDKDKYCKYPQIISYFFKRDLQRFL